MPEVAAVPLTVTDAFRSDSVGVIENDFVAFGTVAEYDVVADENVALSDDEVDIDAKVDNVDVAL